MLLNKCIVLGKLLSFKLSESKFFSRKSFNEHLHQRIFHMYSEFQITSGYLPTHISFETSNMENFVLTLGHSDSGYDKQEP